VNVPPPPRSPPPTSSRSSSSRGGGASNASTCPLTRSDDTLCQLPPEIPREYLGVVQTLTKTHFGEASSNTLYYTYVHNVYRIRIDFYENNKNEMKKKSQLNNSINKSFIKLNNKFCYLNVFP